MKKVPAYVLRRAWIAGVRAQREVLVKLNREQNKNYKPPTHWTDPEKIEFDADYEAGMRAAAEVILGWSPK